MITRTRILEVMRYDPVMAHAAYAEAAANIHGQFANTKVKL